MNTATKLTVKWILIGALIYAVFGVLSYFFMNAPMMKEPPPYALMIVTLVIVVHNSIREAIGLREQENKDG